MHNYDCAWRLSHSPLSALQRLLSRRELLCERDSQAVTVSLMLFRSASCVEMHHVLSRRATLAVVPISRRAKNTQCLFESLSCLRHNSDLSEHGQEADNDRGGGGGFLCSVQIRLNCGGIWGVYRPGQRLFLIFPSAILGWC